MKRFNAPPPGASERVTRLRSQYPDDLIGVDDSPVRLSWTISGSAGRQEAARIEVSADRHFTDLLAATEVDGPGQLAVPAPPTPHASRSVRHFRVSALIDGAWSAWSPSCRVETGLLDPGDWQGAAITFGGDQGAGGPAPVPRLRRSFAAHQPARRARLYATCHGVYEITLNGRAVAPDVFAPGWTTYRRRLLAQTYDVTSLITPGRNTIAAEVADGWFRGRLGWSRGEDRGRYGDTLVLLAQLEIDFEDGSREVVATGADWEAASGEILAADFYDGCAIDLTLADPGWRIGAGAGAWEPAALVPFDRSVVRPWIASPIRVIERRAATLTDVAVDGRRVTRVDVGQNISGHLEVTVRGRRGDVVTLEHAEVVESGGALHRRALRTAEARDTFVLAGDETTRLVPRFTFHGFRYGDVVTDAEVVAVEAVAISSDLPARTTFRSSHGLLDRFVSNVVWSLRDNFVGVPTDCPQRDERLGWTGDAQAFSATACTLVDARQFWASWLRDVALDQRDEGVPSVIPDVVLDGEASVGRAGWADAAAIVPWASYTSYGDPAVLEHQYPSMRRWVETQRAKLGAGPHPGLLGGEFQFGDWCDPDAPSDQPWLAKVEGDFVANAFFVNSVARTADAGEVLGDTAAATEYRRLAAELATVTWDRWRDHALTSQTGCALAVVFDLAPSHDLPAVAGRLAELVRAADGAVSTGFLGTPLVLPALARFDHFDEAYLMLLRTEVRSWLYQVLMGGTTTWERWDAIRPDGTIHDGAILPHDPDAGDPTDHHMLSFNHYGYGAVVDWVVRHTGGIAPVTSHPGYQRVRCAPRPPAALTSAAVVVDTDLGPVSVAWQIGPSGDLELDVAVPFGVVADLDLPVTANSTVVVDGRPADARTTLTAGSTRVIVTRPRRYGPERTDR